MNVDAKPFGSWMDLLEGPKSTFFHGHTADYAADRSGGGCVDHIFQESLFTQSNARVLIAQSASGMFRMIALPTQVYPLPTRPSATPMGYDHGMYYRTDIAMYAGNLSYQISVDGQPGAVDLAGDERQSVTFYADHWLPLTQSTVGALDVTLVSVAPVADDAATAAMAPAPLPGLPGAIYAMRIRNNGHMAVRGSVVLKAGDLLIGDYEDALPEMRRFKHAAVDMRKDMLMLTRPEGAVGIRLAGGRWTKTDAPFEAQRPVELQPGQEVVIETHIVMGASQADLLPALFRLCVRPCLEWINFTAAFWRERLGRLIVSAAGCGDAGEFSRDVWIRCLLDNFNCLQTDATGNLLAHWQGAPSHMYGVIWGIDVEPTVAGIAPFCPELAARAILFFMTRSLAMGKVPEHSTPIYIAPVILARKWLELTGDRTFFDIHPELMVNLERIMAGLMALRSGHNGMFPSRYSSDGEVARRYDYGTNVKVWYALDSFAMLMRTFGQAGRAGEYQQAASQLKEAIERLLRVEGPFGPQVSGGSDIGEYPARPDDPYYDGEDTSSMLAPIYGMIDFPDQAWINYNRFARSIFCPTFDPEHRTLRWFPGQGAPLDGTAYFARLGGSVTCDEMREALAIQRKHSVSEINGSVHWWPRGVNCKQSLTRCSQGQGAWAWQYLQQWLGLHADAASGTLTFAPQGLLTDINWHDARIGAFRFDLRWQESAAASGVTVRNLGNEPFTLRIGLRTPGAGATGTLIWQQQTVGPLEEVTLSGQHGGASEVVGMTDERIVQVEAAVKGDGDSVLFLPLGEGLCKYTFGGPDHMNFVRLLVINATAEAWSDAHVELACPDGWLAEARMPEHWTLPMDQTPSATVELGEVPSLHRAVAPFWIKTPQNGVIGAAAAVITASLVARTANGKEIRRTASIVVKEVRK